MLIREFAQDNKGDPADKLMLLTTWLAGRADDESAEKQISQDAFINLAKSVGVSLTPKMLVDLSNVPPLSNLIEPVDVNSGVVRYKGNPNLGNGMDAEKAEEIVAKNAEKEATRSMQESASPESFIVLPQEQEEEEEQQESVDPLDRIKELAKTKKK